MVHLPRFPASDPENQPPRCEGCHSTTHHLTFHHVVVGTRSSLTVENAFELVTDPHWLCPYCIAGAVVSVKSRHPEVMAVARMLNELEFRLRFPAE